MNQPLVSVIVPTYDRAYFLPKTIKSILDQDYQNIELIVVNDGSNDNTREVIKKNRDNRIVYIEKQNRGPASARNFGIRKARGKYITFCDDDDIFLHGKLRHQIAFLENNSHFAFCYTNGIIVQNGKHRKFLPKLTQNTLSQLLFENSQILTPSVVVRTKIIKNLGGFSEFIPFCEDYDLWLRIAQKHPFDFIDKIYVEITKNSKSISVDEKKMFRYGGYVKLKNLKLCQKVIPEKLKKQFEWMLLYQQGKFYFFQNKFNRARKYLIEAFRANPLSIKPVIFYIFTFLGQKKFDEYFIPLYKKLRQKPYLKIRM